MRLCSGIFLVAVLAFPLQAQQDQQSFSGKIDVSLVNVDVTATRRGEPLRGLTRDDFEVLEDGVRQTITNFYAIEGGSSATSATTTPGQAPAPPSAADPFRRHVLVLVDNAHSTRHGRDVALGQLEHFIDEHFNSGEYDWSVAAVTRRAHLLLPPTSDKTAIHNAFVEARRLSAHGLLEDRDFGLAERASTADTRAITEANGDRLLGFEAEQGAWMDAYDMRDSADAVVQAIRAFTGTPGRKIILLITAGLGSTGEFSLIPFDAAPIDSDVVTRLSDFAKIGTRLRDVIVREANASNVAFYVLNPEGLHPPGDMGGGAMTNNSMSYWIAGQTGGRMMPGNDVKASLRQFDRATANFYSLAYRPPHGDDGEYHRITVRVKKSGVALQYRDGYVAAPADIQIWRTLASPLGATLQPSAFPVTLTLGVARPIERGVAIPFRVSVPYRRLQSVPSASGWSATVDVFVSIFDAGGRHVTTQTFAHTATGSAEFSTSDDVLTVSREVRVAGSGPHRLVVAVRDRLTDSVGIVQQAVR
jgi:VWFA-related protein